MTLPDTQLMQAYGTTRCFLEKTAGELPLAARMGLALMGIKMLQHQDQAVTDETTKSRASNEAVRERELLDMREASGALRHTPVPMMAPEGMPLGYSEGMVRMASAGLKKKAGMGGAIMGALKPAAEAAPGLMSRAGLSGGAWKWKLPALAGAIGGYKALTGGTKGALGYLSREPAPATFGGSGPGLAHGVNQYGQPQMGTPFMS